MSQSAPLAPLAPVEHGCGKPGKPPERVYKFDTLIDENTKITGLLEKDVSKVITPEEFVNPNEVVTPEEIPSDTEKGHPVIQAYNDKDNNLMLTRLPKKLLYGVPEAGDHCFAIYHPVECWDLVWQLCCLRLRFSCFPHPLAQRPQSHR